VPHKCQEEEGEEKRGRQIEGLVCKNAMPGDAQSAQVSASKVSRKVLHDMTTLSYDSNQGVDSGVLTGESSLSKETTSFSRSPMRLSNIAMLSRYPLEY
jgi:hypothetical protein